MILAFIKRRWILLLIIAVLVGCSMIDQIVGPPLDSDASSMTITGGISGGSFVLIRREPRRGLVGYPVSRSGFHRPSVGILPYFAARNGIVLALMPLWFPLNAVIGWIVLREMQRKEKFTANADELLPGESGPRSP